VVLKAVAISLAVFSTCASTSAEEVALLAVEFFVVFVFSTTCPSIIKLPFLT
jgi:hypothetical protein